MRRRKNPFNLSKEKITIVDMSRDSNDWDFFELYWQKQFKKAISDNDKFFSAFCAQKINHYQTRTANYDVIYVSRDAFDYLSKLVSNEDGFLNNKRILTVSDRYGLKDVPVEVLPHPTSIKELHGMIVEFRNRNIGDIPSDAINYILDGQYSSLKGSISNDGVRFNKRCEFFSFSREWNKLNREELQKLAAQKISNTLGCVIHIDEVLIGRPMTKIQELAHFIFGDSSIVDYVCEDILMLAYLNFKFSRSTLKNSINAFIRARAKREELFCFLDYILFGEYSMHDGQVEHMCVHVEDYLYMLRNNIDVLKSPPKNRFPNKVGFPYVSNFYDTATDLMMLEISAEQAHNKMKRYIDGKGFSIGDFKIKYENFRAFCNPGTSGKIIPKSLHDFLSKVRDFTENIKFLLDKETPTPPFKYPKQWKHINNTSDLYKLSVKYNWCAQKADYLKSAIKGEIYFFYFDGVEEKHNALIGYEIRSEKIAQVGKGEYQYKDVPVLVQALEIDNSTSHPAPDRLYDDSIENYEQKISDYFKQNPRRRRLR